MKQEPVHLSNLLRIQFRELLGSRQSRILDARQSFAFGNVLSHFRQELLYRSIHG